MIEIETFCLGKKKKKAISFPHSLFRERCLLLSCVSTVLMKGVINEGAVILVTQQSNGQVNIIVLYSYILL